MDEEIFGEMERIRKILEAKADAENERCEADREPLPRPTKHSWMGSRMKNLTVRLDAVNRYTSGFV